MLENNRLHRLWALLLCIVIGAAGLWGCSGEKSDSDTSNSDNNTQGQKDNVTDNETEKETESVTVKDLKLTIDEGVTYQTMESFGASGAWWSQDVGGWTEGMEDGVEPREQIATLLYDRGKGIGLTNYRYNIGAGTADSIDNYSGITDIWRRAESFLDENGNYDWTKDENAVWFMNRAVELGADELVFFCNSPIVSLTKNGKGCGEAVTGGNTSNLPAQNYRAFAEYVLDVVEHFIAEGYPVKYVSPINEPQWEWTSGQEGCHYEPEELVAFLNVFLDVMEERKIEGLELSAPELGEWGNTSYKYYDAIFADERLKTALTSLDVHSYWSDANAKISFMDYLEKQGLSGLNLKMSEWCEMTNGKDTGMSSAMELAITLQTDLTKLNVTSWQYWIAVSCYDYRDGLIYVFKGNHQVVETKRLWALGNFSRFVRPGYVRVDSAVDDLNILSSAFKGTDDEGKENLVVVLVNNNDIKFTLDTNVFDGYTSGEVYVTDKEHSLEKTENISETANSAAYDIANSTADGTSNGTYINIPAKSIVTVTVKK